MKSTFTIGLFLFALSMFAQNKVAHDLKSMEDSLVSIFEQLEAPQSDDADKLQINQLFNNTLRSALQSTASFNYRFTRLKSISILTAPDKKFKIFTWAFATSEGLYHYYGFTQHYNKKTKTVVLRELHDKTNGTDEYASYGDSTWYGAVYYEIVPLHAKKDTCYLLLGWDGNNWMSKKKLIEPISFNSNGKIHFGQKILKDKEEVFVPVTKGKGPIGKAAPRKEKGKEKQRIVFEYAARASMTLSYNKPMKMIVFDHLAPSDPAYKNMFMFYAPDFSLDAYYYKNNVWYFSSDIDVRNNKIIKAQPYSPQADEDIKLKKTEFNR